MNFMKTTLFLLLSMPLSLSAWAAPSDLEILHLKTQVLTEASNYAKNASAAHQKLRLEFNATVKQRRQAENNYKKEKTSFSELVAIDDSKPGSVTDEALSQAKKKRNASYSALNAMKKKEQLTKVRLAEVKTKSEHAELALKGAANEYNLVVEQVIDRTLHVKLKALQAQQTVVAEGTHLCGDNEIRGICKKKAAQKAETKAIEKGSVVTVSSVTKMKNFQISEDIVKSEVSADVIGKEVLKEGWKQDHDTYLVKIRTQISPNISKSVVKQLRENIAREIKGGRLASLLGLAPLPIATAPVVASIPVAKTSAVVTVPLVSTSPTLASPMAKVETDLEKEVKVYQLSSKAGAQVDAGFLFEPIDSNALATLGAMIALSPKHMATQKTARMLANKVAAHTEAYIKSGQHAKGVELLKFAKRFVVTPVDAKRSVKGTIDRMELELKRLAQQSQYENDKKRKAMMAKIEKYKINAQPYVDSWDFQHPDKQKPQAMYVTNDYLKNRETTKNYTFATSLVNIERNYKQILKIDPTHPEAIKRLEFLDTQVFVRLDYLIDDDLEDALALAKLAKGKILSDTKLAAYVNKIKLLLDKADDYELPPIIF